MKSFVFLQHPLWEQSPLWFIKISHRLKTLPSKFQGYTALSGTTHHFAVLAGGTVQDSPELVCVAKVGLEFASCSALA